MEFSYNLANLPESVEGADGASLTYSYLSDGSKWRASANDGPSILYRGSFVYEDDGTSSRISSIAWDEGRISYHYASAIDSLAVVDSLEVELGEIVVVDTMAVDIVEDGICDEWHVRDHLGSVRAIAGIGNYITGIRELNSYLPFGTRVPGSIQAADNRHRFSGKEEQRYGTFNIGLSDFGARYYDPFTCRWTTRDPMAGKYLSWSPYNYCAGNPVNLVDPEGQEWEDDGSYIKVHVNISNSAQINSDQLEKYKDVINSLFNKMIFDASKGKYGGQVLFYTNNKDIVQTLDFGKFGDSSIGGTTSYMSSFINVYNKDSELCSPEQLAQSAIHEMLHTLRLDHPFSTTQTADTELENIGINKYRTTSNTDMSIKNNVMNYPSIIINGENCDPKVSLTNGQFEFLKNEIRIQNSGHYFSPNKNSYNKYEEYWLNWPGVPVK